LEQLITNLVSNAIKYSPSRAEVKILLSKTEEHVILEVEDHGIGMDQEVMKHIFSKFYQANVYETDGLGLGLYLSKSIVEAHQGTIEVESEPGKGSRFRVQLPLLMKEEKKKNTSIKTD
jgi:signal transduction histidine kinase